MTSAYAYTEASAMVRDNARTDGCAGSQLHETWAASRARGAAAERRKGRRSVEREYRVLAAVTFPIFLAVAAGARLLPAALRERLCGTARRSVLGDAKAMLAATIPIAFTA